MKSKLTLIGEKVLAVETVSPSPEEVALVNILLNGDKQGQTTPREIQFQDDFIYLETHLMKVSLQVSDPLKYLCYRMASGDTDVLLFLIAGLRVIGSATRSGVVDVEDFIHAYRGFYPSSQALKDLANSEQDLLILKDPLSWSI